jgi:uncharacterized protein YhaN
VEGFGGLGPLSLSFAHGLNLVLGPNEAGKTCLMEFIRAMLFGLSKRDRAYQLYLPLDGKPYGGRAMIEKDGEEFALMARFPGVPKVEVNERSWGGQSALLYSRIFSLGLAQVSDLTLLSGQEMAQHLYSTTLGPLGKAYALAVEELEKRREEFFKLRGQKPLINKLLKEIREAEVELSGLRALPLRYGELLEEIRRLGAEIERADEEWVTMRREREEWDALAKAHPIFSRLEEVQRLLKDEKLPPSFPPQGLKRLEDIGGEIDQLTQELEETRLLLGPMEETLSLPFQGNSVLALGERIQALREEWPLIKEIRGRLLKVEDRLSSLDRLIEEGLAYLEVEKLPPRPTGVVWEKLKGFVREFERLREERVALEKERDLRKEEEKRGEGELETLKGVAPQKSPLLQDEVIGRLGFISQARDHIMAAPSLWEMGVFLFLLVVGIGGTQSGSTFLRLAGGGMALLGIGGVGWACYRRWRWKRETRRLAKILDLDKLTFSILETVEKELKEMEEAYRHLNDWKRRCSDLERAVGLLAREMRRLDNAMEDLELRERALAENWERWVIGIGLSPIYPHQVVQDLLHRVEELHRAYGERGGLLKERKEISESLKGFHDRLSQVLSDLDLEVGSWEEGMVALGRVLEEAKDAYEERKAQEAKASPLRERRRLLEGKLAQKKGELERLLQEARVTSVGTFRELAQGWEKREVLEEEAKELRLQLAGLLGGDWKEWVPRLAGLGPGEANRRLEELTERELRERRDGLIHDHARLCRRREELEGEEREQELAQQKEELIEKLRETINKWTVDSIAIMLFRRTREVYERENQPRVLQEASRFFSTMTGGRYNRVYLPIGEEELWVERSDGRRLSSRYLSRGTGEQIYLSLSMAIMIEVAQRGIAFPVVLDDILVNFDPTRASKAAEAILSLSNRLQVLFFTCHPHIVELFQGMEGVTSRQIPPSGDS